MDELKTSEKAFNKKFIASFSVIIVAVLLFGVSAFAYFTSDISTGVNTITSASFVADVYVDGAAYDGEVLEAGEHKIILTPSAFSTASTGYCILTVGESTFYTDQIENGVPLEFTVTLTSPTEISFASSWGNAENYGLTATKIDITAKTPLN